MTCMSHPQRELDIAHTWARHLTRKDARGHQICQRPCTRCHRAHKASHRWVEAPVAWFSAACNISTYHARTRARVFDEFTCTKRKLQLTIPLIASTPRHTSVDRAVIRPMHSGISAAAPTEQDATKSTPAAAAATDATNGAATTTPVLIAEMSDITWSTAT